MISLTFQSTEYQNHFNVASGSTQIGARELQRGYLVHQLIPFVKGQIDVTWESKLELWNSKLKVNCLCILLLDHNLRWGRRVVRS